MNAYFLFISGGEIAFVLFIVVMIFGADKIPEIARGLGKGMTQLKNATNEIKSEISKSADVHGLDASLLSDVKNEIAKVKETISPLESIADDITGPIKRQL